MKGRNMLKIIVMLLLVSSVGAATKFELRDRLDATGSYIHVDDPALVVRGKVMSQYYIRVFIQRADSLAAKKQIFNVWVKYDDSIGTEEAWFEHFDPTVVIPPPDSTFRQIVLARMVSIPIEGTIISQGAIANKEWVIVTRYVAGSDSEKFKEQKWKITRTDGTTWSVQQSEP